MKDPAESPAKAQVKRKRRRPARFRSDISSDSNSIPDVDTAPEYVSKLGKAEERKEIRKRREEKEKEPRRWIHKKSLSAAVGQDLENLVTPRNLRSKNLPPKEEKTRGRAMPKRLKKTPPNLKSPFVTDNKKKQNKK